MCHITHTLPTTPSLGNIKKSDPFSSKFMFELGFRYKLHVVINHLQSK